MQFNPLYVVVWMNFSTLYIGRVISILSILGYVI